MNYEIRKKESQRYIWIMKSEKIRPKVRMNYEIRKKEGQKYVWIMKSGKEG